MAEDGMEDVTVFVPDFEDKKPTIGLEFSSLDEIYAFYNRYAKEAGFSVRKDKSVYWKNSNELMMKYYVCSKEGESKLEVAGGSKRRHGIQREGCNARLVALKKQNSTIWVISQFVEEHSHILTTPHKVHLLRSHREVSTVKKQLMQEFSEVNIPMSEQIAIYEVQAGGVENMGCTQKDLYNYKRDLQKEMDGHDVELLEEHFTAKKTKNSAFYFKLEVGNDDRLDRCFWADATSRRAYGFYGDVVVFDTTHNTNRYGMKFAPFVGVNKHGQTVVFACAFLSKETTESFLWLFDQFKKAMPGQPKMIITDQDAAITNAVHEAFPETFHRFCIWHIEKKFPEKLDATSPDYDYDAFRRCIWDSETREEFDSRWAGVVDKTKSVGNVWLSSIFLLRSKWVPIYVNHVFSAGMTSSQRVESNHAFFKRYVSRRNSLFEFIIRFNRALSHQRHAELEKDHIDLNSQPVLKTPMPMEKQMGAIYTRQIFYKFQDELWTSMACVLMLTIEDDNQCTYKVIERKANGSVRERKVFYEKDLNYACCSCKKFESEGIPCRHILAYLRMAQFEYLPDQYISKRWTKGANSHIVADEDGGAIQDVADNSLLMKKSKLSKLASKIIEQALLSDVATQTLFESFESTYEKINSMVENSVVGNSMMGSTSRCEDVSISQSKQQIINDPLPVRGKGSGKRLRGGAEKATEKSKRHCGVCDQSGHDRRKCPVLKSGNSMQPNSPEGGSDGGELMIFKLTWWSSKFNK